MNKLVVSLVTISSLAAGSAAFAGTPVQLTDNQLDVVTAGGHATAFAGGFASGGHSATSITGTLTAAGRHDAIGIAISYDAATGRHSVAASFAGSSASSR